MFIIINGNLLMCSAYLPDVILEYKLIFVRLPVSPFVSFKLVFSEEPFRGIPSL
jgi:hypothetical protein